MPRTSPHTRLVESAKLALGRMPDLQVWHLKQGKGSLRPGGPRIFWGLMKGASVLICCLWVRFLIIPEDMSKSVALPSLHLGRLVCLEAKTGVGRLTAEQLAFRGTVIAMGGFYAVFRNVEQAVAAVDRARGPHFE